MPSRRRAARNGRGGNGGRRGGAEGWGGPGVLIYTADAWTWSRGEVVLTASRRRHHARQRPSLHRSARPRGERPCEGSQDPGPPRTDPGGTRGSPGRGASHSYNDSARHGFRTTPSATQAPLGPFQAPAFLEGTARRTAVLTNADRSRSHAPLVLGWGASAARPARRARTRHRLADRCAPRVSGGRRACRCLGG